jgi:hypothetical protein
MYWFCSLKKLPKENNQPRSGENSPNLATLVSSHQPRQKECTFCALAARSRLRVVRSNPDGEKGSYLSKYNVYNLWFCMNVLFDLLRSPASTTMWWRHTEENSGGCWPPAEATRSRPFGMAFPQVSRRSRFPKMRQGASGSISTWNERALTVKFDKWRCCMKIQNAAWKFKWFWLTDN